MQLPGQTRKGSDGQLDSRAALMWDPNVSQNNSIVRSMTLQHNHRPLNELSFEMHHVGRMLTVELASGTLACSELCLQLF